MNATPEELCTAQVAVFVKAGMNARVCQFGKPNPHNPEVVFTGCPACSNKSREGVTVEQQTELATRFIEGIRGKSPTIGTGQ